MVLASQKPPQQKPPPMAILEFVTALMRSLSTGRLYATRHELYKKSIQQVFGTFRKALEDRPSLFLGCAKESLFFEGNFYRSRDTHLDSFLKFSHSLGISHLLLDKNLSLEELESFISLLTGTQPGHEDALASALGRENIQHASVGLFDYRVFSTAQAVAARFAQKEGEESFWQQLILQPAAGGGVKLPPDRMNQLVRPSQDVESLKHLLAQLDRDMRENQPGVSISQRGMLIANFLHNLEKSAVSPDPEKRDLFAQQVGMILNSMEPGLRIQILGAGRPGCPEESEKTATDRIIQTMSDKDTIYLLFDALQGYGASSPCFINLFKKVAEKYQELEILLSEVRTEMQLATQERRPGSLNHWQHLEQLILERQEIEELNARYSREIGNLAESILVNPSLLEENEMDRLVSSLSPDSLRLTKARLILEFLRELGADEQNDPFLGPLMRAMRDIVLKWLKEERSKLVGTVLRQVFLFLQAFPKEAEVRKTVNAWLTRDEIQGLLKGLFEECRTYDSKEMADISAISQLFPEKTTGFLIDRLAAHGREDNPQRRWLLTALAGMGENLLRPLRQRLRSASEKELPQLILLAETSMNPNLASVLQDLLGHKEQEIRALTISALAHLKAESAVPRLAGLLREKTWLGGKKTRSLQMHAARALAEIGTPRAKSVLQETAKRGSGELQQLCQQLLSS